MKLAKLSAIVAQTKTQDCFYSYLTCRINGSMSSFCITLWKEIQSNFCQKERLSLRVWGAGLWKAQLPFLVQLEAFRLVCGFWPHSALRSPAELNWLHLHRALGRTFSPSFKHSCWNIARVMFWSLKPLYAGSVFSPFINNKTVIPRTAPGWFLVQRQPRLGAAVHWSR